MKDRLGTGSVQEVLALIAGHHSPSELTVGFLQSPNGVSWVRRRGEVLENADGPLDLDWVFDLRLFDAAVDFHWWWDGERGLWSVMDAQVAEDERWEELTSVKRRRSRLLRGGTQGDGRNGWSTLWDGQAAPFAVPLELSKGQRASVTAVEYTTVDDKNGNVSVVAERYTGLQVWKGQSK